jgi:SAM-dependent methyltransferase
LDDALQLIIEVFTTNGGILVGIFDGIMRQVRKPSGLLGRAIAHGMNCTHNTRTNWGLEHVKIVTGFKILDIGCGGGGTVKKLADIASEGKVCGIDYSPVAVETARRVNRKLVEAKRVEISEGTVSDLPYSDNTFDLVTAIETHYYWPNLIENMKEVLRVLKLGAAFLVVGGEYKGSRRDERDKRWARIIGMSLHTVGELEGVLCEAGFSNVEVYEDRQEGWICGVCRKPWE